MAGIHTGLMIGLPFCGRPTTPWWGVSLTAMDWPSGINRHISVVEGMEVGEARNRIVEQALTAGDEFIWFIDDDTLPPQHAAKKLMRVLQQDAEVMVVGGIYCSRDSNLPEPYVWKELGKGVHWNWKIGDIFKCEGLATGCMMLRTDLFKHMEPPWFRTVDTTDTEAGTGEKWTDDLYFCDRFKRASIGKMVAHGGVLPIHWNTQTDKIYGFVNGPSSIGNKPEPKVLTRLEAIKGAQSIG